MPLVTLRGHSAEPKQSFERSRLLLLSALFVAALAGCTPLPYLQRDTMASTLRLPEESVQKLQLFLSASFELTAQKQTKDERQVDAAAGKISREVRRKELSAQLGTPVRAIGQGADFVDIDPEPNSGITLRFTANPASRIYVLSHVNGQALAGPIKMEDFQYQFTSSRPVSLRYRLGEELRVLTDRKTLKGAKAR